MTTKFRLQATGNVLGLLLLPIAASSREMSGCWVLMADDRTTRISGRIQASGGAERVDERAQTRPRYVERRRRRIDLSEFFRARQYPAARGLCPIAQRPLARVAGAEEQVENAALLFDPADPANIARAITNLYLVESPLKVVKVPLRRGFSQVDTLVG